MENFFLVWNEQTNYTRFRHTSIESARNEASRLARDNPGIKFFVLTPFGFARKSDVEWVEQDNIPF